MIDISLPDGNGFTVCTEIKAKQDIPVIFLTASGDEASVVTGLKMGAHDYITKPFRPRELIARIGTALRKSETPRGRSFCWPFPIRDREKASQSFQEFMNWENELNA